MLSPTFCNITFINDNNKLCPFIHGHQSLVVEGICDLTFETFVVIETRAIIVSFSFENDPDGNTGFWIFAMSNFDWVLIFRSLTADETRFETNFFYPELLSNEIVEDCTFANSWVSHKNNCLLVLFLELDSPESIDNFVF